MRLVALALLFSLAPAAMADLEALKAECDSCHGGAPEYAGAPVKSDCRTCHQTVANYEDCGLCHNAHGSNHAALLTQRSPLLCQQCHSSSGHPSLAYTSESADDVFQQRFLLGRSCSNCHTQVHGSNHPSGVQLTR